ncbi:XRE family transcriptional regulator [Bradyrhizobium sp. 170]|uniref:helix-turn-helix domain-containing protein n=1 Tax=Bradyrhizobium sp. 170 TaxID=2782641 RepID=UPI001FFE770B|nr:XRE family transcriptional regulator [Bradyrhizobium sp. 170]UPK01335.1 helix-turn-helix transcriptional regulator [Bradyrhizobium sp. 170]
MTKKTSRLATSTLDKPNMGNVGRIGARLRACRRQKNMTLDDLAKATGLNKGFLSRIEKDAKAPSIATVIKLSRALDIPVGRLFGEQIVDSDIHLVRMASHKPEEGPVHGYSFIPLSPAGSDRRNEAFLMLPPRQFSEATHAEHAGEEMLYVISGRIEVKFVDRSIAMSTGDYLQFPGHLVHHVRRISANANVLIVISRD